MIMLCPLPHPPPLRKGGNGCVVRGCRCPAGALTCAASGPVLMLPPLRSGGGVGRGRVAAGQYRIDCYRPPVGQDTSRMGRPSIRRDALIAVALLVLLALLPLVFPSKSFSDFVMRASAYAIFAT